MKFEVYHSDSNDSFTLIEEGNEKQMLLLEKDARLLKRFKGEDWNDAKKIFNQEIKNFNKSIQTE